MTKVATLKRCSQRAAAFIFNFRACDVQLIRLDGGCPRFERRCAASNALSQNTLQAPGRGDKHSAF